METSDQPDPSLAPAAGGRAKVVFFNPWEEQRKQTFRCQAVCGRIVSDCSWCRRPTAFSKTKTPGGDRAAVDSDIWFSLAGCESGPGGSTVLLPAGESPLTAASAPDSAGRGQWRTWTRAATPLQTVTDALPPRPHPPP